MEPTITAYETSLPAGARTGGTFRFDRLDYDAATDVLRIERGPDCAVTPARTPEGDTLELSAPDGRLMAVHVVGARKRLRQGDVQVTIGPSQAIVLEQHDLRGAVLGGGRFVRDTSADPHRSVQARSSR